jgi:hypothetical protein
VRPLRVPGRVAEWFKAAVLKTAVGASSPWVRIPPLPPGLGSLGSLLTSSPVREHYATVRPRANALLPP